MTVHMYQIMGVLVPHFQPIRFDNESVNRGLLVLEAARGFDSWRSPNESRALETRMANPLLVSVSVVQSAELRGCRQKLSSTHPSTLLK